MKNTCKQAYNNKETQVQISGENCRETIGSHKDKLTFLGPENFEEIYIMSKMNTGEVSEHSTDQFF